MIRSQKTKAHLAGKDFASRLGELNRGYRMRTRPADRGSVAQPEPSCQNRCIPEDGHRVRLGIPALGGGDRTAPARKRSAMV
jgi:hypothetical protein